MTSGRRRERIVSHWYCEISGSTAGPFTLEELKFLAARGKLSREDQVKQGIDRAWMTAASVKGLFRAEPRSAACTPRPLTPSVLPKQPSPSLQPATTEPTTSREVPTQSDPTVTQETATEPVGLGRSAHPACWNRLTKPILIGSVIGAGVLLLILILLMTILPNRVPTTAGGGDSSGGLGGSGVSGAGPGQGATAEDSTGTHGPAGSDSAPSRDDTFPENRGGDAPAAVETSPDDSGNEPSSQDSPSAESASQTESAEEPLESGETADEDALADSPEDDPPLDPGTFSIQKLPAADIQVPSGEPDRSRRSRRSRRSELDEFGNPKGDGHGLARDGEFEGAVLLAWTGEGEVVGNVFPPTNPLWKALEVKGFKIRLETGAFPADSLENADQLWVFSGIQSGMSEDDYATVERFVGSGKGLYLVCDNEPYLAEATVLARRLFGTTVSGNYTGGVILAVRGRKVPKAVDAKYGRTYEINDHPLLTGINFLYEGITISHVEPTKGLNTVLTASDGQILAAVSRSRKQRVIVDCGFTRYYTMFVTKTAGTVRYAENVAAYLMGKRR